MVKIDDEQQEKVENGKVVETALDESNPDPYFAPIVSLPEVEVPTGEDEEEELFKMRAKLFRFDTCAEPPEWKERGTGDVKLMQNKENQGRIRVIMRRDKTLKICANHFIQPWMLLKPMKGSDRAWMWLVRADFADEVAKAETLAIRFANSENAKKFKDAFDCAVVTVTEHEAERISKDEEKNDEKSKDDSVEVATGDKLAELSLKDKN